MYDNKIPIFLFECYFFRHNVLEWAWKKMLLLKNHNAPWWRVLQTRQSGLIQNSQNYPVKVWTLVQQPLDQGRILGHTAHVQHVLAVVLLAQVDVVQQLGKPFQHPAQRKTISRCYVSAKKQVYFTILLTILDRFSTRGIFFDSPESTLFEKNTKACPLPMFWGF